jgi:hypothetical protein
VHNNDGVFHWYDNKKPSREQAEQRAKLMGDSWRFHGVHKWMAYDRYASEIGRAGLAFAFDVLGVQAVVSCTVRHNIRSRAVMERIGMRYAGEIRSRGMVEGLDAEQDDAPFAVSVPLAKRLGPVPGARITP